jgi:hypothetical protein
VSAVTGIVAMPLRGHVPLQPDRDQARAWAEQELSRPEYRSQRPNLIAQAWSWVLDRLQQLPHPAQLPGNLGVAIAAAVLITLVCYVLWRSGGVRRSGRQRGREELFGPTERTAAEYRSTADAALAAADLRAAVLERFRGLIRGLQERALLDLQPGRTADEAARTAGAWLPDLADELAAAAGWFDDVRYGNRAASRQVALALGELDQRVQRARPARTATAAEPVDVPR